MNIVSDKAIYMNRFIIVVTFLCVANILMIQALALNRYQLCVMQQPI